MKDNIAKTTYTFTGSYTADELMVKLKENRFVQVGGSDIFLIFEDQVRKKRVAIDYSGKDGDLDDKENRTGDFDPKNFKRGNLDPIKEKDKFRIYCFDSLSNKNDSKVYNTTKLKEFIKN